MKERTKRIYYIFAALFALVITIISGQAKLSAFPLTVNAEETIIEYSSPLEDLEKNENFDKTLYPIKADDYSLSVITVAESENLQLFVYVYQPSYSVKSLIASSINISTTINNKLSFTNYKLVLLGQDGVFQKYLVSGLIVNSDNTRNYQISSIFRVWDSTIDQGLEPTNENTIDEVSFEVAKIYTFELKSGRNILSVSDVETIKIIDKYVGFCRYNDGYTGSGSLTIYKPGIDSHFVAFSTDKKIDYLYQADVFYCEQTYKHTKNLITGEEEYFGEVQEKYAYLTYEDKVEVSIPNGFFHRYNYEWGRIQTVSEFIETEDREIIFNCGIFNVNTTTNITDEGMNDIKNKDWVLRFAETEQGSYTSGTGSNPILDIKVTERSIVSNVTILRLLFESDGVPYNLGVIDNKQTGDGVPDNETKVTIEYVDDWVSKLVALILVVLLFAFFWPYLVPLILSVFKIIIKGVKLIIKIAIFIITIPLRLIGWIFKKK